MMMSAENSLAVERYASPVACFVNDQEVRYDEIARGWVYIAEMENTIGVLMIGKTSRDPELRIKEWTTGQPGKAYLIHSLWVENYHEVERRVKSKLRPYRVHGEWFKCDVNTAIKAVGSSGEIIHWEDHQSVKHSPDKWGSVLIGLGVLIAIFSLVVLN